MLASLMKVRPDRLAGGAQSDSLTVASSRTWRGSQGSAAPVPSGRALRIPQERHGVNAPLPVIARSKAVKQTPLSLRRGNLLFHFLLGLLRSPLSKIVELGEARSLRTGAKRVVARG